MKITTIRLPESDKLWLREQSANEGITVSELIRRALSSYRGMSYPIEMRNDEIVFRIKKGVLAA